MVTKAVFFLMVIPLLALGLVACDDTSDSCKDQSYNHFTIGFYTVYKSTSGLWVAKDSTLSSIVVQGVNVDSIRYKTKNIKSIDLPLSQCADSCKFAVTINSMSTDTFSLFYKRSLVFISYKCGYRTNFDIQKLMVKPQNPFDSIVITHSNVSNVSYEHCKIYLKPAVAASH